MRLLGTCAHKFSSKPGDVCGRTLIETDVMGWLGHASPVAVAHYPVLRSISAAASVRVPAVEMGTAPRVFQPAQVGTAPVRRSKRG